MRVRLLVEDVGPRGAKSSIAFIRDGGDLQSQHPMPCKIQVSHCTEFGGIHCDGDWEDIDVVFRSEVGDE